MPVMLRSPKSKVMNMDGEYDPMIAEENEATWGLKCDRCGKEDQGTTMELHENWEFEFKIDPHMIEITESEATCQECLESHEKAENDPKQKKIGEL